jgi:hypothetical protein
MYAVGGLAEQLVTTTTAAVAVATDPHLPQALCLIDRLIPGPSSIKPSDLAADPHLAEIVCHVLRLKGLEEGRRPETMTPCQQIPRNYLPGAGIGLRHAITPLRIAVTAKEHPVITALVGGAMVAGLVGFGYMLWKSGR